MDKYPNLRKGLEQIPVSYLKDNLLPLLKDKTSPLIFSGELSLKHKDGFRM